MKEQFVCSQSCHRWASGATVVVALFVGFIVVVEEIYTSVAFDFADM